MVTSTAIETNLSITSLTEKLVDIDANLKEVELVKKLVPEVMWDISDLKDSLEAQKVIFFQYIRGCY